MPEVKALDFAHAACFVRRGKQLLLLDCKNQSPLVYPRCYPSQLYETVKAKEDIESDVYHQWDLYYIDKRVVNDEMERQFLHNRMKKILTGELDTLVAGKSLSGESK